MSNALQQYFSSILRYDPDTGVFIWKMRPPINKSNNIFNALFAGKQAGSLHSCKRSKTKYIAIKLGCKTYKAHRIAFLIMQGILPEQVDHIDHNGTNNAWNNLRASDKKDNARNLPKLVSNKSSCIGVNWHKAAKKWQVRAVNREGVRVDLGRYDDLTVAIQVRKKYEKEFGYHQYRGGEKC